MDRPMTFISRSMTVQAIQWTGTNVRAVQDFVAPWSPSYRPPAEAQTNPQDHATLRMTVRDHASDAAWPTIAPHWKEVVVVRDGWIIRLPEGHYDVLDDRAMQAMYVADVGGVIGGPIDVDVAAPYKDRLPDVDVAGDVPTRELVDG